MLPASMSRPTTLEVFFLVFGNRIGRRIQRVPPLIDKKSPDLLPCNYRFLGEPGRLYEKVARYQSISSFPSSRPTIAPKARKGPNGIAFFRADAPSRAISTSPTAEPAMRATSSAGATLRPRKRPIVAASLTSPSPIPDG